MPCGGMIRSGKEEYRKFQSCGSVCTRLHLSKNAIPTEVFHTLVKDKNSLSFLGTQDVRGILFRIFFKVNVMMTLSSFQSELSWKCNTSDIKRKV